MTETTKKSSGVKHFLISTLADPVLLYTVLVMMSIMYHYRSSLALAYGLLSYVAGWLVFRIFDFVNKHHIIGFLACIVLYIAFGFMAGRAMEKGAENYPITWGLWFLTPQDSLKYNKWYTLAIYILFLIFMLSVIYYFTRVRYRILMNFLIFIIPFAIYGKEYEKMPIGYIIGLAIGYVLMMVTFRQLHENDKTVVIDKAETWKSVAVFTAIFAVTSTILPKPTVEADRSVLEMLIDADAFTTRLDKMLDVFRDTSSGSQFRGKQSTNPLYYLEASEQMRLKNATFSTYNFQNDTWKVSDIDTYYQVYDSAPINIYTNGGLADAILYVAGRDKDFADKYGISDIAGKSLTYSPKTVSVYSLASNAETMLVPQGAVSLKNTSYKGKFDLMRSGALITDSGVRYTDEEFDYEYISNEVLRNPENMEIIKRLSSVDDYQAMLDDAYDIISDDDDLDTDLSRYYKYKGILNVNARFYESYLENLLDYGGDSDIYDLAKKITDGAANEYEMAKNIEWYFIQNDYKYDLDYQKAQDENVHDFIFKTKTGVCVEYATAMVMLSRAAGIPARYCEGYLANEEYHSQAKTPDGVKRIDGFVLSANDGHAFPELYIKGYGWVTFEPTMTNIAQTEKNKDPKATTHLLSKAGVYLLIITSVLLLLVIVMPIIMHKLFIWRNNKRTPDAAVAAVVHRLCRLYGITNVHTANEAAELVNSASGADISATAAMFNRSVYGGAELNEADRTKAMEEYLTAYEALIESKKQARKRKAKT